MDYSTQIVDYLKEVFNSMRYITLTEILSEEIDFSNICVIPVREPLHREGVFADKKRHCNVLFMYICGKRRYTLADGSFFDLLPNNILYVPQHSTYRFNITEADENGLDYAIAINFTMRDQNGEAVCLGTDPTIICKDTLGHYFSLFQRALNIDTGIKTNYMPLKSVVYSLCYELFNERQITESQHMPWRAVLPAIDLIESFPSEDIPIPELARQCGISETLFRQLFKQYTGGESAVTYRNRLRLEQVERLLHTEQVTVEYAARKAGFRDMSHFYRLYKRHNAQSDKKQKPN
jgi:AraC-like DNA-binding protein